MILIAPGIVSTDAQGNDNFVLHLFNGEVPTDEAALGNRAKNYWDLIDSSFCGSTQLKPTIFGGKHTRNDNIRFSRTAGLNVPFGLVEKSNTEGHTYKLYPSTTTYTGSDPELGSNLDPFSNLHNHALNAACNVTNTEYYMDLGEDSEVGDYLEITYPYKHIASGIVSSPYPNSPINYRAYLKLYAYDYDLEDWVLLINYNGDYSANKINELPSNTVMTDKYKLEVSGVATSRPVFQRFEILTDSEPTHIVEQPTWAMLVNRTRAELYKSAPLGMPFILATCSGPTGNGELILHNDNLSIGEHVNLLSNEITFGSLWEEVV